MKKINWKSILTIVAIIAVYLILRRIGVIGGVGEDNSYNDNGGLSLITQAPDNGSGTLTEITQTPTLTPANEAEAEPTSAPSVTEATEAAAEPTATPEPTATQAPTATVAPTPTTAPETRYYFRNNKYLTEHFEKHGSEFTYKNKEEYEAGASAVINNPAALSKPETDSDNTVFYIEATNEFVVLSADGYIRTYFKPSAGKAYFDRQ